jgi:hypothetical protein
MNLRSTTKHDAEEQEELEGHSQHTASVSSEEASSVEAPRQFKLFVNSSSFGGRKVDFGKSDC